MKIFTTALTFGIVMLFTIVAQAQTDDYIITTTGDTVKCSVDLTVFGVLKYQAPGGKKEKIVIEKIKEYYKQQWNEARFRAVYRDTLSKPDYMLVVESGPICLYQYTPPNFGGAMSVVTISAIQWFISKNGGRATAIKSTSLLGSGNKQERKDALLDMLKDKPEVYNQYANEGKFTFPKIRNIVHLYNTGQPYKAPEKKKLPDNYNEY